MNHAKYLLLTFLVAIINLSTVEAGNIKSISNREFLDFNSSVEVKIEGLKKNDKAIVKIQKSNTEFFFKEIEGRDADIFIFFDNIPNGRWALSIDAKGYVFPAAQTFELSNNSLKKTIKLEKSDDLDYFSFSWQDDESFAGHAQQAYINDVVEVDFLGKKERIPDDFNAIYLYNQFGFLLSDEESTWTSEDAYRLFQLAQRLPFERFGEGSTLKVKAKWVITEDYIDKDISYTRLGDVDIIRISRAAFTYATPQVVTVDGVKGKFFSKRLFNALVYYLSDAGFNVHVIDNLAKSRYGIEFLQPSEFLRTLMGETESNFQVFTPEEKIIILTMLEEFPDAMQRQEGLKYLVRRINGQQNPIYPQAPAIAWVSLNTIEFMEMAFKGSSIEYMQRLVLHEKAHFLWEYTFDQKTKDDWAEIGGWYLEPTSSSGWATTNTTEFVSAYGHAINPNEDMAESIAYYITNPEKFRSRSIRKFEFVRDRIMNGSRYISIIRPDLTFEVFNLFPDYNYPGKIIRTKVDVFGEPTEDKRVVLEIELKMLDEELDGAAHGQCTFFSSIGTLRGMALKPVNAQGSILRGEFTLSKYVKSGYWNVPQIFIYDEVGNHRLENNSTYGIKVFINNPLEDVEAPYYVQESLKLDVVTGKFKDFGGQKNQEGTEMQAIQIQFEIDEKNTMMPAVGASVSFMFPSLDDQDDNQSQPYSKDVGISGLKLIENSTDTLIKANLYLAIPNYYPSGKYAISQMVLQDLAFNNRLVFFDEDSLNTNLFVQKGNQRSLRQTIDIQTPYPDYKPPILDLNDIQISAIPTIPESPNGETNFEMKLWIKDESDHPEHASGFLNGYYTLRDPQGLEHGFSIFDVDNYWDINPHSSAFGFTEVTAKAFLPAGSPPGIWGVSSITLFDKAGNRKFYNFVETVRFDVEVSKVLQIDPKIVFLEKAINANNQVSGSLALNCDKCKDQNYRIRVYSSMGGASVVFEGKMEADSIVLNNLDFTGVNDGVLFATAFILDAEMALIGIGKTEFSKDTVVPKARILQTNLSKFGISNIDDLILRIETEEEEENASYEMTISQHLPISSNTRKATNPITVKGSFDGNAIDISEIPLNLFDDGEILFQIILIDAAGNQSDTLEKIIYKDTKRPITDVSVISGEGLLSYVELKANEYISNVLNEEQITISKGEFTEIKEIANGNYILTIVHECFESVQMNFSEGMFKDTVNNESSSFSLLVEKDWAPTIKAKNIEASLDSSGIVKINPSAFDDQSETLCGELEYLISKDTFTCADLGENTLTFSIQNEGGFSSETTVNLLIKDVLGPLIKAKNSYILPLSSDGTATLRWEDIDEGSTDNCGIAERILSKTEFSLSDNLENRVTYTITDQNGNQSSKEIEIIIDRVLSASNREASEKATLKLFPNPAKNLIVIQSQQEANLNFSTVKVYDNAGRIVLVPNVIDQSNTQIQIDIQNLKNGLYFLQVSSGGFTEIMKFNVIR